MAFVLTKDKGQRMWGGGNNTFNGGRSGGGGGSGAGGGGGVSSAWVDENYVSKDYFNQLFAVKVAVRVLVTDPSTTPATVISDTTTVRQDLLYPNEVPEDTTTTDEQTGYVTSTTYSIDSIQVMGGLWTNSYLSALGQNSSGGGGGGGSTTLAGLVDVALNSPTNGQALVYDSSIGKWVNATIQQSGGTVTSITAGTGLSGGTITGSGTIAIESTYQTYISHGETAYGWGNHANAGYATQTWVTNQNFLTQSDGDGRYLKIDFFRSLFRAYNSSGTEVQPNNGDTSTIDNIKAMFGFWTNAYISALGQNSGGGGGGGSSTLEGLNDVNISNKQSGDVLTYDGNGHWVNTPIGDFLTGYATQTWVQNQHYLTGDDLTGYATQYWVQNQHYLTGITSSDVTSALGYTPLSNQTTFWGRTPSNGVVNGSIEAGLSGGAISGFHSIEFNTHGSLSDYGGFIDFHFDGSSSDYTSRIIEDASGRLYLSAPNGVRIGNAVLKWDSTNNALYLQKTDGTAVNLYATGGVSALGMSAGTSAVDAMTFNYVTINNQMSLPSNIIAGTSPTIKRQSGDFDCVYLFYANASSKISDQSYYYNQYDNVGLCGSDHNYDETWVIDPDGCARFKRLYLDSSRYLYVSNGTLYYYNGSSAKQVAFTN